MACCSSDLLSAERHPVSARVVPLPEPKPIRCAIYTRKSTEEGLDQEFNSLDAQRECAEAYIQSQRHERWTLVPRHYDDGGFTGANIDRPALKQLLTDIESGAVDCVVVYKVDRLSRSLLDFARIMEVFDKGGVSFVSVTQQLNSSSPMGRLTLNVLLSFAQFEREIISERTRDKVCAARRKGKWIGGYQILGYDLDPLTRKLVANQVEAEQVRRVFKIFVRKSSLAATLEGIESLGIKFKGWTSKRGRHYGGVSFNRAGLVRLLKNHIYVGEINHKGTIYPGEQPAIVDRELWDRANQLLASIGRGKETTRRVRQDLLLSPLLYCAVCGSRMIAGYARNHGRTYPYYTCILAQKRGAKACPGQTVQTARVEQAVVDAVRQQGLCHGHPSNLKEALHSVVERIDCNVQAREVRVRLKGEDGAEGLEVNIALPEPMTDTRPRQETTIEEPIPAAVPRITQLIALAIRYEALLAAGAVDDYTNVGRLGGVTRARVTQIMNLRHLAPAIQERLLFLDAGSPITERELRVVAREVHWAKQMQLFEAAVKRTAL
jgi:site-specific DNA recombinase